MGGQSIVRQSVVSKDADALLQGLAGLTNMSITIDIFSHVYYSGHMDIQEAITVFDALSQETRLRAFRLLVQAGPDGLPAGVLSAELGTPHNTLSFHLNHLSNAGIVSSRKEGRSVIYSANFDVTRDLIGFMVKDCCSVEFASIREDRKTGCSIIELANCYETQTKASK